MGPCDGRYRTLGVTEITSHQRMVVRFFPEAKFDFSSILLLTCEESDGSLYCNRRTGAVPRAGTITQNNE